MSNCKTDLASIAGIESDPIFLSQKGKPNGVPTLDSMGHIPLIQLPQELLVLLAPSGGSAGSGGGMVLMEKDPVFLSQKGVANGVATLDASVLIPTAELGTGTASSSKFLRGDRTWAAETDPVFLSQKGVANGVATLDNSTLVPTAELGTGTANSTTFLRGDRTYTAPLTGLSSAIAATDSTNQTPGGSFGDVSGSTLVFTPPITVVAIITATICIESSGEDFADCTAVINIDGVDKTSRYSKSVASQGLGTPSAHLMTWQEVVILTAVSHTVKIRAKGTGSLGTAAIIIGATSPTVVQVTW